jgi:uncharacterized protein (TIGR03435 family)
MSGGRVMIMRGCQPPDLAMVRCTNMTLKGLMVQAYGVKNYQIEGPAWLDTDGFDLEAKLPEGASKAQIPAMLQALIAERFKVTLHKENKPLPVYELAVAKGGPKLTEVDPAELNKPDDAPGGAGAPPPLPPPPPGGGGGNVNVMVNNGGGRGGGNSRMTMSANGATTLSGKMSIGQLVSMISRAVDRPILDSTSLKGIYDISLTYLAENAPMTGDIRAAVAMSGTAGGAPGGADAHQSDASAPIATVFQALKTLGLTLEPKKAPLEILVIDNASRIPTEN